MYMLVNNVKFPVSEHVKLKPSINQSPTNICSIIHISIVVLSCNVPTVYIILIIHWQRYPVFYADIVQNYHSDNNITTFLGCVKECPTTCVNAAKPRFQNSKTSLSDSSCPHMNVTESLLMSVCWIQNRGSLAMV